MADDEYYTDGEFNPQQVYDGYQETTLFSAPEPQFVNEIRLDNTKRSKYRECMRKGYWEHYLGLRTSNGSMALLFGSTMHGFWDGFYSGILKFGWDHREKAIESAILEGKRIWDIESAKQNFTPDYRNFETASTVFLAYVQYYASDKDYLVVKNTEQSFGCPLTLVTEEEKRLAGEMPPIIFTGRLDLQVESGGRDWVVEHKTTGSQVSQQGYRLNRSAQVMGYSYAAPRILDFKPEGCLVSITQVSSRKNKDGLWGKLTIDFGRFPQIFTDKDLAGWKESFISTCADIYKAEKTGIWPQNHDACFNYNSTCVYLRLCQQNVPPEDTNYEGFIYLPWDVEDKSYGDAA